VKISRVWRDLSKTLPVKICLAELVTSLDERLSCLFSKAYKQTQPNLQHILLHFPAFCCRAFFLSQQPLRPTIYQQAVTL